MKPLDPCPYCVSESMIRKMNAFGGVTEECLDCGYVREVKRTKKSEAA